MYSKVGWYGRGHAPPVTARGEASAAILSSVFI